MIQYLYWNWLYLWWSCYYNVIYNEIVDNRFLEIIT